ncbi:MAG: hypothetical protein NVSMB53_14320 [Gemmatimonadaceae bacterium]
MPIQFEVDFSNKRFVLHLDDVEGDLPLVGWKVRVEGCYDIPLPPIGLKKPPEGKPIS